MRCDWPGYADRAVTRAFGMTEGWPRPDRPFVSALARASSSLVSLVHGYAPIRGAFLLLVSLVHADRQKPQSRKAGDVRTERVVRRRRKARPLPGTCRVNSASMLVGGARRCIFVMSLTRARLPADPAGIPVVGLTRARPRAHPAGIPVVGLTRARLRAREPDQDLGHRQAMRPPRLSSALGQDPGRLRMRGIGRFHVADQHPGVEDDHAGQSARRSRRSLRL